MENHVKKKLFGNNCDNMTDNPILSAVFCLSEDHKQQVTLVLT